MKYILLSICLFLGGCLNLLDEKEPRQQFFLSSSPFEQLKGADTGGCLKIQNPIVPTWLESKRLFLKKGSLIQPLDNIELVEPLGDHLLYHLVKGIRETGLYKSVGSSLETLETTHTLAPRLEAFWIEEEANGYKAFLKLSLRLSEEASRQVLWHKTYTCQHPLKGWSQDSIIKGLEKVLNQCLNDIYKQLGAL